MEELEIAGHKVDPKALTETFATSGGPGGQHANRNETAVRLSLDVDSAGFPDELRSKISRRLGSVVEATASDSRSQFRNRALARSRLRERVEASLIDETPRKPTKPTRASKRRRIESKRARSERKRLRKRPDIDH